ncbi:DUF2637 domain-containing protein [Nocardia pseudobrasiliensis]|uniref:DUF2637 domain-containing protein n=1 Tax=Nocardia pseudobrasiliensis TaxID=45979 RepID=UPI001FE99127|nr:DUF2637 domain-containing protein [Nocardia pseudobrasiliensis]
MFAIVTIVGVGAAAFVLSFAALRDLAVLAHIPAGWARLFPVIIDGTIIQATVSALALANSPERRFFTFVLAAGAVVSIIGNCVHAAVAGHQLPWWAAALVAAVAPVSLLIDTHGLAILLRAGSETVPAVVPEPEFDPPEEVAAEPVSIPDPVRSVAVTAMRRSRPVQQEMLPLAIPVGGV